MLTKIILNSVFKKNCVFPSKTAQTFGFLRLGYIVIGMYKEDSAVDVVRYGSNILQ